jgi:transcriptional regulator with XRE-family HTH domain
MIKWKKFGKHLAAVRAGRNGLGVRDAADEAGVSSATFSRAENGRVVSADNFMRLCFWGRVNLGDFLKDARG